MSLRERTALKNIQGKNGFKEYTDWWNSTFEWNRDPKRMADYLKRLMFPRFFTPEEIDFLFDLSREHPIVVDEMAAGVYDYANVIMDYFSGLSEVSDQLKEKMRMVKEADVAKLASLIASF